MIQFMKVPVYEVAWEVPFDKDTHKMSRNRFYRCWYLYQEVTHRKGYSGEGPVLWEQPASRKGLEQAGGTPSHTMQPVKHLG